MQILFSADQHFNEKNLGEAVKCFQPILDRSRDVDYVILGGDFFDCDVLISNPIVPMVFDLIRQLADNAHTFIQRGNHDPFFSLKNFEKIKTKHPIQAFENFSIATNKASDMRLHFFPYISRSSALENAESIEKQFKNYSEYYHYCLKKIKREFKVEIVIGHFAVEGVVLQNSQTILPTEPVISFNILKKLPVDAILLGHIHNAHQKIFDNTNIRYSGSHHRTNFGEKSEMGFWIFDTDSKEFEWIKTPAKPLQEFDLDFKKVKAFNFDELTDEFVYRFNISMTEAEFKSLPQRIIEKADACGDVKISVSRTEKPRSAEIANAKDLVAEVKEWCKVQKVEFNSMMAEICSDMEEEYRRESIDA